MLFLSQEKLILTPESQSACTLVKASLSEDCMLVCRLHRCKNLLPGTKSLIKCIRGLALPSYLLMLLFAGTNYAFDWRLITHHKDYSGDMEGKHSRTLKLSKVLSEDFLFALVPLLKIQKCSCGSFEYASRKKEQII